MQDDNRLFEFPGLHVSEFSGTRKVAMLESVRDMAQQVKGPFAERVALRLISKAQFINEFASGTLRKGGRVGFADRDHYLHERVAFEFGYLFECLPASRVTYGRAISFADCKPITETGWFILRIGTFAFPQDIYELKYIIVEEAGGKRREGTGVILKETSASWVPDGTIVFAIIAEVDETHEYKDAQNPC